MKNTITVHGYEYLIRGPYTPEKLKNLFKAFKDKYPSSKMNFAEWLVKQGKVYCKVN